MLFSIGCKKSEVGGVTTAFTKLVTHINSGGGSVVSNHDLSIRLAYVTTNKTAKKHIKMIYTGGGYSINVVIHSDMSGAYSYSAEYNNKKDPPENYQLSCKGVLIANSFDKNTKILPYIDVDCWSTYDVMESKKQETMQIFSENLSYMLDYLEYYFNLNGLDLSVGDFGFINYVIKK